MAQEGHGQHPGADGAVLAGQRHQHAFHVNGAVGVAVRVADDGGAVHFQQRAGCFQAAGRIVVAGDDDDIELRRAGAGLLQEGV